MHCVGKNRSFAGDVFQSVVSPSALSRAEARQWTSSKLMEARVRSGGGSSACEARGEEWWVQGGRLSALSDG